MSLRPGSFMPPGGLAPIHRADGEAIAVIGKVTPITVTGAPPSLRPSDQGTQLISARELATRQWVVTLMQATQQARTIAPWLATFDGTATTPDDSDGGTRNFSAPMVATAGGFSLLQCTLSWGAGGAKFSSVFDYPLSGRSFGITADQVELSVAVRPGGGVVYASPQLVPVVGAFMVEGVITDPAPLRWEEAVKGLNNLESAYWSVKPYARQLRLNINTAGSVDVSWTDANGGILMTRHMLAVDGTAPVFDVPAFAAALQVTNKNAGAVSVQPEWLIGLT